MRPVWPEEFEPAVAPRNSKGLAVTALVPTAATVVVVVAVEEDAEE